ncbi:MAG: DUF86 domain-containing protein [Candidatus Hydrogenedentes bacterium]|nr:DUF86 domain-containing protein [Candidatus Hydrogenedentota bacterium]
MTNDRLYLEHIRDAITRIESYTADGREVFKNTPHVQDASIRQFEIIGEASKRLSAEVKNRHSEIPWRRIGALRDHLIHRYMHVDLEIIWQIVENDLPQLKSIVLSELASSSDN